MEGAKMDWYFTALVICSLPSIVFSSLLFSPAATRSLEEVVKENALTLQIFKNENDNNLGQLFLVQFSREIYQFVLSQDQNGVTLVIGDKSIRWENSKNGEHGIMSLEVLQDPEGGAAYTLYRGCNAQMEYKSAISFRDVFSHMEKPTIEVYHKKSLTVLATAGRVSTVLNCKNVDDLNNVQELRNILYKASGDNEQMQAQDFYSNYAPCQKNVDSFQSSLSELINQMKMLKIEMEILLLKGSMNKCAESSTSSPSSSMCSKNPCPQGAECFSKDTTPYYSCGQCPEGYTAVGNKCKDENECLSHPCDPQQQCINLSPGYHCSPCPTGFKGSQGIIGVGVDYARKNPQVCQDVNECENAKNGGCVPNSVCINTEGSFTCGGCKKGFIGNQTTGCHLPPGSCADGTICDINGKCKSALNGAFDCQCRVGWAGNGFVCGKDSDLDGWPDTKLDCDGRRCKKDNCMHMPNSGQEDADGDGIGDNCDPDADNDGIVNDKDNCPLKHNPNQFDSDNDKIGDSCDNCQFHSNNNQLDGNNNGVGDACDADNDNDSIPNSEDNCPNDKNVKQIDTDLDGLGDTCDNCPYLPNPSQEDSDNDLIGDACEISNDADKDGVQDNLDNCINKANSDQLDVDSDGMGDACDPDKDNDGVPNEIDNCQLVSNPLQEDMNNDGVGDACEFDNDLDKVPNHLDNCPNNALINRTNFKKIQTVLLKSGSPNTPPNWVIQNNGADIFETWDSDAAMGLGYESFNGVDYDGTIYIGETWDDDSVGFVFSYQNNRQFYLVTWNAVYHKFLENVQSSIAKPGIQLKLVQSITGPGEKLSQALWHTGDTPNQVKMLWIDPLKIGWKQKVAYRWSLIHRPDINLIRLKLFEGDHMITDSGNIYDGTLKGGRLGVYCFSQEKVTWSDLSYRCNESIPEDVNLDIINPRIAL